MKVRCPYCRDWVEWEKTPSRPFCSPRCKLSDLGKWAQEEYRVAEEEPAEGVPRPENDES